VIKVLLERVDCERLGLNRLNTDWNSPLHLAIEEGHVEVVKELLERARTKVNLLALYAGDNTPLQLAAEAGQDEKWPCCWR
jgi:ankyrin repeat protein